MFAPILLLGACAGAPASDKEQAAGGDYPVKVEACGFVSTIEAAPDRAVTMNQGATEIMLALGLESHLAGTAYLDDAVPKKWQSAYESVKVLSDEYPDHETLLASNPDFIFASFESAFGDEAAGPQDELAELGIGSMVSLFGCGEYAPSADASFNSVWDEIEIVAKAFGVEDRAEALEDQQSKLLDELGETKPGEGRNVFWFDSGDKTAFAGAGQGGPQLILDAVGAENLFADLKGGWADVSWEKVIAADPDVIVLADASWSTAADKIAFLKKDSVLKKLQAVKNEAFVALPFSETTPGVRLADGAVAVGEQLAKMN